MSCHPTIWSKSIQAPRLATHAHQVLPSDGRYHFFCSAVRVSRVVPPRPVIPARYLTVPWPVLQENRSINRVRRNTCTDYSFSPLNRCRHLRFNAFFCAFATEIEPTALWQQAKDLWSETDGFQQKRGIGTCLLILMLAVTLILLSAILASAIYPFATTIHNVAAANMSATIYCAAHFTSSTGQRWRLSKDSSVFRF